MPRMLGDLGLDSNARDRAIGRRPGAVWQRRPREGEGERRAQIEGAIISLTHSVERMRTEASQGYQGVSQISHAVLCGSTLRVGLQTLRQARRRTLMGPRLSPRVVQGSVEGDMDRKEGDVTRSKEEARRFLHGYCS